MSVVDVEILDCRGALCKALYPVARRAHVHVGSIQYRLGHTSSALVTAVARKRKRKHRLEQGSIESDRDDKRMLPCVFAVLHLRGGSS